MSKGTAYFVEHPSTIYDLRVPHLLCLEKEYDIVKTIQLSWIDYENFCFDLLADRQFTFRSQTVLFFLWSLAVLSFR